MRNSILKDKNLVQQAINSSNSIKDVLTALGLRPAGGNYENLKIACESMGLILPIYDHKSSIHKNSRRVTNEEIFVVNSAYRNRTQIKKRLFALGILNVCNNCGQKPEWNGSLLTLTLEHKNGIYDDNRLENLEILCPNCHSQTSTFAGKNSNKKTLPSIPEKKPKLYSIATKNKYCLDCDKKISKGAKQYCRSCAGKHNNLKRYTTEYPSTEKLIHLVKTKGFVKVGESLGVSDQAVRKHLLKSLPAEHLIFNKKKI